MSFTENIFKLYSIAKRTALLAHDKKFDLWYHLFSVIELLPLDIQTNDISRGNKNWKTFPTSPQTFICRSEKQSDIYNFYLVDQKMEINEAMECFNNPLLNNVFDNTENNYFNPTFVKEPSGTYPLFVSSNMYTNEGIGSILPKRNSGSFVWSQIDSERIVEKQFYKESISSEMKAMSQLTSDWLGFDIWFSPEHIGNIYLSAPSPYLRDLNVSLSRSPMGIFYKFKLREKVAANFKVRIIDKHGDNIAFDKLFEISEPVGIIKLPHEPHETELRIYNEFDDLIAIHGPAVFINNIQVDMSIKQADFQVKINEEKSFTIEKFSSDTPLNIGKKSAFNAPYYFKRSQQSRKYVKNRDSLDFVFLKGAKDDSIEKEREIEEAKAIIREIINKAKHRCYICDPYFSANDLINFAFYIQNSNAELKILTANDAIDKNMAKSLEENIEKYNKLPFQKIQARVLKSNVLHDRFIVVDNNVWYIGTSLNQIGNKATCIAKVPESDDFIIIAEVEKWFLNKDKLYSYSLSEFIAL